MDEETRAQDDFRAHTELQVRLVNDIIVGLFGILILMIAIAGTLIWLSSHPGVGAFLPEWLHPNPASLTTLPEGSDR